MKQKVRRTRLGASSVASTLGTYNELPSLPRWNILVAQLKLIHAGLGEGGADVWLYCQDARYPQARWVIGYPELTDRKGECWPHPEHKEHVPAAAEPFDYTAAAKRLVSWARLAGFKDNGPKRYRHHPYPERAKPEESS